VSLILSEITVKQHLKPVVFIMCLLPLLNLVWLMFSDALGVNPVEEMTHHTGDWALRFLLIALAVTPLRKITGWILLLKLRRMLGLYAFFYAVLHFITYIWFDQFFDWMEILLDIPKRPFITIGFAAFILLIPLAVTSSNAMVRRLKKNWIRLHRLVYVIPMLVIIHFIWLVKADVLEPLIYAMLLSILLGYRVWYRWLRS